MAAQVLASVHDIELQVVDGDTGKLHPSSSVYHDHTAEIDPSMVKDDIRLSAEKLSYPVQGGVSSAAMVRSASEDASGLEAASAAGLPVRVQSAAAEWFQFSTLSMCMFLAGWNDAIVGPLLDTMQTYYGINYTVVSSLFLSKTCGYIIGCGISVWLSDKIGFGKCLVLGAGVQTVAYAVQVPAPPFAVMAAMNFIVGWGLALQHAQCNGFVASIREGAHSKMSMLHALYGAGAVVSPFVATQFAHQPHWAYINIISCGLSAAVMVELAVVFKGRRQEEIIPELHDESVAMIQEDQKTKSKYSQIFSIRAVHYLGFFIIFYTGLEITVGSWIVTYVIELRNGPKSSGYIASGFYAGLMLGRVVLLPLSEKVGHRRVVFLYCALAAAADILVWQLRSFLGNAITVSFMGMFLGPLYPLIMSECAAMIPRHILTGAIGWIAGFGQIGSAAFPFMTGALASRFGIRVMPPLVLAMVAGMPILFAIALLDKQRKRVGGVA